MIDISVIVVCFNEEENIRPCLESLVRQNYPVSRFEIIVVDGGSRDRTAEIIAKFTAVYDNVRLVVELGKGTAIGRNAGVDAARHSNIAFLDADCEAPPDWLERLALHYKKHRNEDAAVVAVGGSNVPPPDSPPSSRRWEWPWTLMPGASTAPKGGSLLRSNMSKACRP